MAAILNNLHLPGGGSNIYTFSSIPSTTAGSLLLLFMEVILTGSSPNPIGTVTDNQSQSWTVVQGTGNVNVGGHNTRLDMAYMWNTAAAVTSVTMNVTAAVGGIGDCGYFEASGIQTTSDPFDGNNVTLGSTGTAAPSGSFTTTATDAIFTAIIDGTAHSTAPSGYSTVNTGNSWFCDYDDAVNLAVASGTQNPTWTASSGSSRIVMAAAFKLAAAAGGLVDPGGMMGMVF